MIFVVTAKYIQFGSTVIRNHNPIDDSIIELELPRLRLLHYCFARILGQNPSEWMDVNLESMTWTVCEGLQNTCTALDEGNNPNV